MWQNKVCHNLQGKDLIIFCITVLLLTLQDRVQQQITVKCILLQMLDI